MATYKDESDDIVIKWEGDMKVTEIFKYKSGKGLALPFYSSKIKAGFPSPADDYIEKRLDLNELIIKHPASTFFVRVEGESMIEAGIYSGDILVVDKSLPVKDNCIVIASVNGDFTVKRIRKKGDKIFLQPENCKFEEIEIAGNMEFDIFGVVTFSIRSVG